MLPNPRLCKARWMALLPCRVYKDLVYNSAVEAAGDDKCDLILIYPKERLIF